MLYLLHGMQVRPKIQDQLFLVSKVSDKIRSDLKGQIHQTIVVEPNLLRIGSGDRGVDYRINEKTIERLETQSGKSLVTSVWKVPYSTLSFSSQQGRAGFIVVDLDWRLSQPGKSYSFTRETKIPMEFAAQTVRSVLSEKGDD